MTSPARKSPTKRAGERDAAARESPVRFVSPDGLPSATSIDAEALGVIGRIADKWTMSVLEVFEQDGVVRCSRLAARVGGIRQRMPTKTLRQLEADDFVTRTVHADVPPRVEYAPTARGRGFCKTFCGVWRRVENDRGHAARSPRH